MGIKITEGFTDSFNVMMEGTWLILSYRGKAVFKFNIKDSPTIFKDYEVYIGERDGKVEAVDPDDTGEEIEVSVNEVLKFAQAYQGLQRKYTGRYSTYLPGSDKPSAQKNWAALTKATAQAKKNDIDHLTYLTLLMKHYTRRAERSGAQMSFPFPNQIAGDWAQHVIIEELARSKALMVDPEVMASRLAGTNRYLSLEKDQAYIEARARCKTGKFTRFDIEYMKARTTQFFGQPKDWVLKYEKQLDEREAQAKKDKVVEDDEE